MRGLVQRVRSASVDVVDSRGGRQRSGQVGAGLCVLLGVTHTDTLIDAHKMADKLWGLRILDDREGVMNLSLSDVRAAGGTPEMLVVSQFTLYGDSRRGRRPSWGAAARPEHAEPLVERVVERLRSLGCVVETGRFRTDMEVSIVNDGPVTVMIDVPPVGQ